MSTFITHPRGERTCFTPKSKIGLEIYRFIGKVGFVNDTLGFLILASVENTNCGLRFPKVRKWFSSRDAKLWQQGTPSYDNVVAAPEPQVKMLLSFAVWLDSVRKSCATTFPHRRLGGYFRTCVRLAFNSWPITVWCFHKLNATLDTLTPGPQRDTLSRCSRAEVRSISVFLLLASASRRFLWLPCGRISRRAWLEIDTCKNRFLVFKIEATDVYTLFVHKTRTVCAECASEKWGNIKK